MLMTTLESQPHTYSQGTQIFVSAAHSFGAQLDSDTPSEWTNLLEAAYLLDGMLDSQRPQEEREATYDAHVAALFDESVPLVDIPEEHLGLYTSLRQQSTTWTSQKHERVITATAKIKVIAAERRATTSPRMLGLIGLREGFETAQIFAIEGDESPANSRFNAWLVSLLKFGIIVDTIVDLQQDYTNGLNQVEPTPPNRARLIPHALPELARLARLNPLPLYAKLFRAMLAVTDDTQKDSANRVEL